MVCFIGDWRHRHAALMAISACGEGCKSQMETMLNNIVDAILPFLQDPVRYTSIYSHQIQDLLVFLVMSTNYCFCQSLNVIDDEQFHFVLSAPACAICYV